MNLDTLEKTLIFITGFLILPAAFMGISSKNIPLSIFTTTLIFLITYVFLVIENVNKDAFTNGLFFGTLSILLFISFVITPSSAAESNCTYFVDYNYYRNETFVVSNLSYVQELEKELVRTRSDRDLNLWLANYYQKQHNVNVSQDGVYYLTADIWPNFSRSNICQGNCTVFMINVTVKNESIIAPDYSSVFSALFASLADKPSKSELGYMGQSLEIAVSGTRNRVIKMEEDMDYISWGVGVLVVLFLGVALQIFRISDKLNNLRIVVMEPTSKEPPVKIDKEYLNGKLEGLRKSQVAKDIEDLE